MAHTHSHKDNTYYLEQLFTIGVCGALGGVAVMLWYTNKLQYILHPKFHLWVLLGGIAVLVMVAIRAVAVWFSVAEPEVHAHEHHHHDHDHDHDHDHGHHHHHEETGIKEAPSQHVHSHDHGHAHGHSHSHSHDHDHDHDHGHSHDDHEHGWAPWRYVILMLPVLLYFLGLPNKALMGGGTDISANVAQSESIESTGVDFNVGFKQLELASLTEESRGYYAGKTVRLLGMYLGNTPERFTLVRPKITCCAADVTQLRAVIFVNYPGSFQKSEELRPEKLSNKWVRVTGQVQFVQNPKTNEWLTTLVVTPTTPEELADMVTKLDKPPSNAYVY